LAARGQVQVRPADLEQVLEQLVEVDPLVRDAGLPLRLGGQREIAFSWVSASASAIS
jgi:hypothetical protein